MRFLRRQKSSRPLALPLRVGLFALIFVAVVMIGSRLYDIVVQIAHGQTPSAFAPLKAAEAPVDAKPETQAPLPTATPDQKADPKAADVKTAEAKLDEKKPDNSKIDAPKAEDKKAEDKKPEAAKTDAAPQTPVSADKKPDDKTASTSPAESTPAAAPEVADPSLDAPDLTESEINVLRHLSDRRKELDKKTHELDERETLLSLSEQRVDKKIAELKKMQEDIRKVLGEADADYKAKIASMVKIYETMKPKDAARIFEKMDTPTLVDVVSRMKEAKAAPVLAAMDALKAKEVSAALMTKKPLPAAP